MVTIDESKVIIEPLSPDWVRKDGVAADMLRLDLIHPVISGNKWYKLKHNIEHAKNEGYKAALTFGGAYSNHLVAAATSANIEGITSIGVVRGNDNSKLTDTLKQCEAMGMKLHFITRDAYARRDDIDFLEKLSAKFNDPFIIPEGGANEWGRIGAEEIAVLIPQGYTHVCVSVGTGTTFTGLRNALPDNVQLMGFVPMKQGRYLEEDVKPFLYQEDHRNWQLFDEWHFGGFGKSTDKLIGFMNEFYNANNIPLDIVYTGKMMYGVKDMLVQNFFPKESKVLCIHTGGLQGNVSVKARLTY